jgi:hypothetical protein
MDKYILYYNIASYALFETYKDVINFRNEHKVEGILYTIDGSLVNEDSLNV